MLHEPIRRKVARVRRRRGHRHQRIRRLGRWTLILAACGLLSLPLVVRLHPPHAGPQPSTDLGDFGLYTLLQAPAPSRAYPVYPYSVIPGGAFSSQELREAIDRDPVVALHYRDFQLSAAHVVRLESARAAYVSYRLGNEVFWTRKKLRLPAGERLITDGKHYARTRCGNRISASAQEKTSPNQPPPETLNMPQPLTTPPAPGQISPFAAAPPTPTAIPPGISPGIAPPPGGPPVVSIFIPAPPLPPRRHPTSGSSPPPPPPPVPEPGTLVLMGSGLGYVAYRRRARRKVTSDRG